jgi:dTDP-4-dehydrorhamnose reductase
VIILLVGASGLLGAAIRQAFSQTSDGQFEVLALGLSRSRELGLVSLDLTKGDEVEEFFRQFRPNCELYC